MLIDFDIVSSLIEEAEKKLRDAQSVSESLYGEYLLKTQKLVDCDVSVRLWQAEYDAILDKECQLEEEEKELTMQCVRQ